MIDQTDHSFPTSWEGVTWALSFLFVGSTLAVSAIVLLLGMSLSRMSNPIGTYLLIASLVGPGLIVLLILLSPIRYEIGTESVRVRRPLSTVSIPLERITAVRFVEGRDVFRRAVRTLGSGGAFGFFGRYRSPQMGDFIAYATRTDRVVVLTIQDGETVVVSPESPELFVAAVDELHAP